MYWVSALALASSIALVAPSYAAALTPEKATELLAKAWVIDNRCDVLGEVDRDDLTRFVARAEISVAEKVSVKAAQSAIARGRAQGKTIDCDAASAKLVKDVLNAARNAVGPTVEEQSAETQPKVKRAETPKVEVAAAPIQLEAVKPMTVKNGEDTLAEIETLEPTSEPPIKVIKVAPRKVLPNKLASQVKRATRAQTQVVEKTKPSKQKNLGYARTAETYYKELRCRQLSPRAVNAMYARVLRQHQQAVVQQGRSAVRSMLRAAETRAAQSRCS